MSDKLENTPESECTVCYAAHDEEIHQATLSIRRLVPSSGDTRFRRRNTLSAGIRNPGCRRLKLRDS